MPLRVSRSVKKALVYAKCQLSRLIALMTSRNAKVKSEFWSGLEYTFDSEIGRALYFVSLSGVAVAN